jgi:hypothetical protein
MPIKVIRKAKWAVQFPGSESHPLTATLALKSLESSRANLGDQEDLDPFRYVPYVRVAGVCLQHNQIQEYLSRFPKLPRMASFSLIEKEPLMVVTERFLIFD